MRRKRGERAAWAQARLAGPRVTARGLQESQAASSLLQEAPDHRPGQASWSSSCLLSPTQMGAGELENERWMEGAPLKPHRQFLKQKSISNHANLVAGQGELHAAVRPSPSTASQGRANTVLRKLAQIENKIQRRKAGLGTGSPAVHQMLMDEEFSWSKSSQDLEQGAGGPRYLKTDAKPKENLVPNPDQSRNMLLDNRVGLGREKEDTGLDASRSVLPVQRQKDISQSRLGGKPFLNSQVKVTTKTTPPSSRRSSPASRSSTKRLLHRSPSPPSRNAPVFSWGTSHSLSSSIHDSLTGRSLAEGSVIRSLDELFLSTADTQGSSSSDFQVNVLSLADLAPSTASQKGGLAEEATMMETSGSLSTELEPELLFADTQSAFKPLNITVGEAVALEEDLGETEISEQLSGSSIERPSCEQGNPTNAEYSEDFESLSEDAEKQSFSEDSWDGSDASLQSGLSEPSSLCLPQVGSKRSQSARRITMKEVAVQTNSSSLIPHGLKTAAAAIDWIDEGLCPASHVVSTDALPELTTYSPAVSALNDMLKQNLLLIQQFVEASRHLHLSFVALLEEEEFHYHTLEETKMYIDHHKHPPLTLEQTLHELDKEEHAAIDFQNPWERKNRGRRLGPL